MDFGALPTWYMPAFFALLGAIFGSFSAVVVDRSVRQEEIGGRSGCASCGAEIPWYLNLPLVAWPALRGKAACCDAPIPAYLWLTELVTAAGFLTAALLAPTLLEAVAWSAYVVFAVIVGGIDAITRLVYYRWVLIFGGSAWLAGGAAVVAVGEPGRIVSGLVGAGTVVVALEIISLMVRVLLRRPGIGRGDTYIVAISAGVPAMLVGDWVFGLLGFAAGWMLGGVGGVVKAATTPEIRQRLAGIWWVRAAVGGGVLGAAAGALVGVAAGIGIYWPSVTPLAVAGAVTGLGLGVVRRLFGGGFVGTKMAFGPFLVAGPFLLWAVLVLAGRGG